MHSRKGQPSAKLRLGESRHLKGDCGALVGPTSPELHCQTACCAPCVETATSTLALTACLSERHQQEMLGLAVSVLGWCWASSAAVH
jgi:hypothetical protein